MRSKAITAPGARQVLRIENLTFAYRGRVVLDNVSLQIGTGETVILLGPNGAGKSTLFSIIAGLFEANCGTIEIAQQPAGYARRAALGIVFQAQTLDLDLTIAQNLHYGAALQGLSGKISRQRIATALAPLGLTGRENNKVRTLNGGHRRRVEIARAGLHKPALLLLDEPTVGLDIATRTALVRDLHAQNCALFWSTHLIDEIWDGDRVLVIDRGRIVADGHPAELMAQTGMPSLVQAFAALTEPCESGQ